MDYTSLAIAKASLRATGTTDDKLLARIITSASRYIDRETAGALASDYFQSATVTGELGYGSVSLAGNLRVYPRKPTITAVASLAYRHSPAQEWIDADATLLTIDGASVEYWLGGMSRARTMTKITYTGGYATTVDGLPADIVEATTMLAVRWYNEAVSGLNDVIGVSELGQVFFAKAVPQRVRELLQPYRRITPWEVAA